MNIGIKAFLTLAVCLSGGNVYASCKLGEPWQNGPGLTSPARSVVALNAIVSAPADMPVGSVLYEGRFGHLQLVVECTTTGAFYNLWKVDTSAGILGTSEDFNTTSLPAGLAVFRTAQPGVGVAFDFHNYTEPVNTLVVAGQCSNTFACLKYNKDNPGGLLHKVLYLIKTGPITPGTLTGASPPVFSMQFGQIGSMLTVVQVSFTGSVTVTTPSCTTPDVSVPMGTWNISDFHGKGSGSEWKDASIRLTGCDQFYGYRAGHNLNNGGTVVRTEPANSNRYTVTLTPQSSVIDNTNGIMSINESENSASGVGIQIGIGSVSSAASNLVRFGNLYQQDISSAGSTVIFPLAARYVQTDTRITPGRADGKVTFTIEYK